MNATWTERVEDYVHQLQQTAETIDLILDETRLATTEVNSPEVEASTQELLGAVGQLEKLVETRETLLRAGDAPAAGLTLSEKLFSTRRIDDARLAKQCREVAKQVETTHQRAVSLFVCQYHLSQLGSELLQLLSGSAAPDTYGQERRPSSGGNLFNDAA